MKVYCESFFFFLNLIFIRLVGVIGFFLSQWAIFQQYHGENKLIFNEMMMRSALY
jgi:hypothetical protein